MRTWRCGFSLIFVGLPIIEIALFIKVGGAIGLLPTLGIVVADRDRRDAR